MFRFEFEKFRRQRILVGVVALVMLAVYISSAFRGMELMGGWSQEYFWSHPEYREQMRSYETEYADAGWIQETTEGYHAFVDGNRRTDEEIRAFMEAWYDAEWMSMGEEAPAYEAVISDPYNFQYAHDVLKTEAYESEEFEYFSRAFRIYLPLAENAPEYLRGLQEKYTMYKSWSGRQEADWNQMAEEVFADFTPVMGYSCGWDVLLCVGQRLPYTLGLVLLAALCTSFSAERASFMVPLLRTTRFGRRSLVFTKLMRAWLITTVLWLIFQLGMLFAVAVSYGLEGAEVTVMLGYLGYPSAWGLNNLQYYLIQSVFSYFGTLLQGLLICLMSCLFRARLSLPAGLVLTLILGFPNESFFSSDMCFSLWQKTAALTPTQMMGAFTTLQSYQSYDIGICLLQLPFAVVIAMILEAAVMIMGIFILSSGFRRLKRGSGVMRQNMSSNTFSLSRGK